jgi:hypothetical protein
MAAEPKNCPVCGATAELHKPKARIWRYRCSKYSPLVGGHRIEGHPMYSKREAIRVWNELDPDGH